MDKQTLIFKKGGGFLNEDKIVERMQKIGSATRTILQRTAKQITQLLPNTIFVFDQNEEIIGYGSFIKKKPLIIDGTEYNIIERCNLAIAPEYRGNGIGKKLSNERENSINIDAIEPYIGFSEVISLPNIISYLENGYSIVPIPGEAFEEALDAFNGVWEKADLEKCLVYLIKPSKKQNLDSILSYYKDNGEQNRAYQNINRIIDIYKFLKEEKKKNTRFEELDLQKQQDFLSLKEYFTIQNLDLSNILPYYDELIGSHPSYS